MTKLEKRSKIKVIPNCPECGTTIGNCDCNFNCPACGTSGKYNSVNAITCPNEECKVSRFFTQ